MKNLIKGKELQSLEIPQAVIIKLEKKQEYAKKHRVEDMKKKIRKNNS